MRTSLKTHAGNQALSGRARRFMHGGPWLVFAMVVFAVTPFFGQAPADNAPQAAGADEALALEQQRIAEKYAHLEEVLLRMAEVSASNDPRRAALLRKAVAQSKERLVGAQFNRMAELLRSGEISRALENQEDLDKDLRALLELLMSENRDKQLESEKARIRGYLKKLSQLIRRQKDIQGRTEGGTDPKSLSAEQGRLGDEAGGLSRDIQHNEEGHDAAAPSGRTQGGSPAESEDKPAGKNEGKTPGQGEQQGPPGQQDRQEASGGQDVNQPEPPHPARQRLDAARQRMDEAKKQLEKAQRDGALARQEQALRELEQARANLEEVLRQLREEELERMLASLDARLRKMLAMQRAVHDGTRRLDKVPRDQRGHGHDIEAGRLANEESLLVLEADKALAMLRDEGSAVAMPEALAQARADCQQVAARLSRSQVDATTLAIEEDIIAAFEEMIAVMQRAKADLAQNQRPGRSPRPGEPQEKPLVDQLSELKMIRTLQTRVNRRTERYAKLLDGEQADKGEVLDALKRLAEREAAIHRITRDIESGKNQ